VPGAEAVFAGQLGQTPGETGPGLAAVEKFGRPDRLAATAPRHLDPGQRAADPAELGEGETACLLERDAPGDNDADTP